MSSPGCCCALVSYTHLDVYKRQGHGISAGTFDAAYRGAGFIPLVIDRDRNQTEFTRTTEDYLAITASDERVALGRKDFATYRSVLNLSLIHI